MLDAVNYRAIEKLRDGRNYVIRAQRRDDNIIDALQQRAGLRSFYLRFLTRKHRLNNFEAAFYLNVDFIRQVALLADLHDEIIAGARYYIWSPGQADIAFIVGDAYQNKGIASAMLRHLAFIARDAGISNLHAHTLPDNRRALRVLDKLGFPCTVARKRNMMHVTLHLDSTAHPPTVLKQPRKRMSPATDRVLAEGLTCSKTIIRVPSSGALRAYFTGRRVGRRGKSFNDGCVDCCDECIWSIVAALGTSFLIAGSQLPRAETVVIDPTRWTPPDISTVGDVHFGTLVKYGHRLFTNVANEIGPAVSEQSVTEPPHFGRT